MLRVASPSPLSFLFVKFLDILSLLRRPCFGFPRNFPSHGGVHWKNFPRFVDITDILLFPSCILSSSLLRRHAVSFLCCCQTISASCIVVNDLFPWSAAEISWRAKTRSVSLLRSSSWQQFFLPLIVNSYIGLVCLVNVHHSWPACKCIGRQLQETNRAKLQQSRWSW